MRTFQTVVLSALVPLTGLVSRALAADVLVVDSAGGAGADFGSISAAAAAAGPGDVVLVRAGRYLEIIELGSKPLVVTAEAGALVEIEALRVQGLAADGAVVVRGIDTVGEDIVGVVCRDNAGSVWIEDCVVNATLSIRFLAGGVSLSDNAEVVLARCTIEAPLNLAIGDVALESTRTVLHVFDSTILGSRIGGTDGEDAAIVRDGSALLSGVTLTGGRGGDGNVLFCEAGDGGRALIVRGSATEVRAIGSTIVGGAGGTGFGGCASGVAGEAVVVEGGTFTSSPTAARSLSMNAPVREFETLEVAYGGVEGDRVFLLRTAAPAPGLSSPDYEGDLLLAPPRVRHRRGLVDSGGTLLDSFLVRPLGPAAGARVLFLQAYHRNSTNGDSVVGAPATLVILDERF